MRLQPAPMPYDSRTLDATEDIHFRLDPNHRHDETSLARETETMAMPRLVLPSAHAHGLDHHQLTLSDAVKDVRRTLSGHVDVDFHLDVGKVRVTPSLRR